MIDYGCMRTMNNDDVIAGSKWWWC